MPYKPVAELTEQELLKYRAQQAVKRAVHYGYLVRPLTCEECGKTCVAHAHHHKGYEPEHWLDVQWLCRSDHSRIHSAPAMVAAHTRDSRLKIWDTRRARSVA